MTIGPWLVLLVFDSVRVRLADDSFVDPPTLVEVANAAGDGAKVSAPAMLPVSFWLAEPPPVPEAATVAVTVVPTVVCCGSNVTLNAQV
jgi:hypothetical protein